MKDKDDVTMNHQTGDADDELLTAWGKAVLEEVLFQAALGIKDTSVTLGEAAASMLFRISVDENGAQLIVHCDRVNGRPFTLEVPLPRA